ncbi:hypothetical protein PBY51_019241 [Eleginops maclovinus]|uniref:Uncharacterized protein n=1 Tax=Eleginops maclovinus TaxID=56733 RepID=A0AAN7Y243_ELEMC|nr:hypothetical protein PBY51_019241 [Eleginops maclovinus]
MKRVASDGRVRRIHCNVIRAISKASEWHQRGPAQRQSIGRSLSVYVGLITGQGDRLAVRRDGDVINVLERRGMRSVWL